MRLAKRRDEEFENLWGYIEDRAKKDGVDYSDLKPLIKSAFDNGFNSGAEVMGKALDEALFGGEKH